jgi:hypothetical protein
LVVWWWCGGGVVVVVVADVAAVIVVVAVMVEITVRAMLTYRRYTRYCNTLVRRYSYAA